MESKSRHLDPLLRPLRFAARRDFSNIGVLKNAEKTLSEALDRVPDSVLGIEDRGRVAELIAGFDAAPQTQRVERVKALLSALGGEEPDAAPARARRASAEPSEPAKEPTEAERRRKVRSGLRRMRTEERPSRGFLDDLSLENVKGVGPKTLERLSQRGVDSVLDALLYLPRGYEDRSRITPIAELVPGAQAVVEGEVLQAAVTRGGRRGMFEAVISDGSGTLSCRWFRFNKKSMERRFTRGTPVRASGTVTAWGAMRQMVHPDTDVGDGASRPLEGALPVYPEIEGIAAKKLREILQNVARTYAKRVDDPLPEPLRRRLSLPDLAGAIEAAHLPAEGDAARSNEDEVVRRLIFDELFFLQLALARRRYGRNAEPGLVHRCAEPWRETARRILPFELTGAQTRSLDEITRDLETPSPMNRLLQGDVGSGKTAVAMVAAAVVRGCGRQTALLAPTEILAEQHMATAQKVLGRHELQVEILTGSTKAKDRRRILGGLASGEIDVLIGTHALLEPDVAFADLGLSIVDEQHRFGVAQRAALRAKSRQLPPDVLVMTATPIPRTMALTVYGDLDVSIIDERPPGRKPVSTKVFRDQDRKEAYRIVEAALERDEQAYVVFPLVEESEAAGDLKAATQAVTGLTKRFPDHQVELLHGRMKAEEKSQVMDRFRRGQTDLLVSTTVIEVGVDVPNSTVLVLENAERFGLSQVHQLRGRVGRGEKAGTCILIAAGGGTDAWQRLGVLEATENGFEIAEADLRFRGPGEILGTRQSGLPLLMMADLVRDASVLETARDEAGRLIEEDPELARSEHEALRLEIERRLSGQMGFVDVG